MGSLYTVWGRVVGVGDEDVRVKEGSGALGLSRRGRRLMIMILVSSRRGLVPPWCLGRAAHTVTGGGLKVEVRFDAPGGALAEGRMPLTMRT